MDWENKDNTFSVNEKQLFVSAAACFLSLNNLWELDIELKLRTIIQSVEVELISIWGGREGGEGNPIKAHYKWST